LKMSSSGLLTFDSGTNNTRFLRFREMLDLL
jgi:hypothetical protein